MSPTAPFPPGADFTRAIGDTASQLRFLDIDLSVARDDAEISIKGNFLFADMRAYDSETVLSASKETGVAFIRPNSVRNAALLLTAGRVYNWSNRDPFDGIYVTNTAQASKMLRIYYSTGPTMLPLGNEFQLTTTGSVDLESPDGRTQAGLTFHDYAAQAAGGAGKRSEIMLFNSGVNTNYAYVEQISLYTSAAGSTSFYYGFRTSSFGSAGTPQNKMWGGTASQMTIQSKNNSAATVMSSIMDQITVTQYETKIIDFPRPIVVKPGTGFHVQPQIDNILISVAFDYYEKAM